MTTYQEQFIDDYLIVVENDSQAWNYLREQVKSYEVSELATVLEDEFSEMVSEMTSKEDNEVARDLVRQMLLNQGYDTWFKLAKEITERATAQAQEINA